MNHSPLARIEESLWDAWAGALSSSIIGSTRCGAHDMGHVGSLAGDGFGSAKPRS